MADVPPCERCGGTKFHYIPDSLALFCAKCGFVWVNSGPGKYEKGATIQEWLEDIYGKKDKGDVQKPLDENKESSSSKKDS